MWTEVGPTKQRVITQATEREMTSYVLRSKKGGNMWKICLIRWIQISILFLCDEG